MLVDDHDLVRIGFTRLLSDVKGITVVGEARSGEDAVKLARTLKHFGEEENSPFDALSARELQVMMMITSGQKVQDISDSLCLSAKRVNSYRYRLFEKLKVANDVELTHLAIRHGLIETNTSDE